MLHLDIKSSNVLVFDEGRTMKICDFGTAVHINEVASSVGKNLGTPQFAAPEVSVRSIGMVKGPHSRSLKGHLYVYVYVQVQCSASDYG